MLCSSDVSDMHYKFSASCSAGCSLALELLSMSMRCLPVEQCRHRNASLQAVPLVQSLAPSVQRLLLVCSRHSTRCRQSGIYMLPYRLAATRRCQC